MILALESSGEVASVAVVENRVLLCESLVATGLFHSQTLMVMLQNMLRQARLELDDVDLVAVSSGPGSFTGLRIGVCAAKGIAIGLGVGCAGVSTLRGLAANLMGLSVVACAVIDARNEYIYFGLFSVDGNNIVPLMKESVVFLGDLEKILQQFEGKRRIVLVGDAAQKCYVKLAGKLKDVVLAGEAMIKPRALNVGLCAEFDLEKGDLNLNFKLNYMRPSQAQRQLAEKLKKELD